MRVHTSDKQGAVMCVMRFPAAHLERQMPKGWSLADIGGGAIHIDHIAPKSSFDISTPEGLRACWALANLRPVLAAVNLRKGAKREYLL
ncbi:hypothetical protein [Thiohalocapsa marina]|uniref:hypothetical protein n=1 Tax=Thiohalocapsa marina TaxID=424902 RepID=UPI0036D8A813